MINTLLHRKTLVVLFLSLLSVLSLRAQDEKEISQTADPDIFQLLSLPQGGVISIFQPEVIRLQVRGVAKKEPLTTTTPTVVVSHTSTVYRIQAYMGNSARSRQEVYGRKAMVQRLLPSDACYISYRAPFWTLKVGNFPTREEANKALRELRKKAPSIAQECYIVKDKIKR